MKGSYILLIKVNRPIRIKVGNMGIGAFKPGFYAYVGSAFINIEKNIQKYLSSKKKLFWHIGYKPENA